MLVVSDAAMRMITEAIVNAAHSMTDTTGTRATIGTMEPKALRTAALVGLSIATGEVVWPGSEPLRVGKPQQQRAGLQLVE